MQSGSYGCSVEGCAEHCTYPAEMLRLWDGEPICQGCYDHDNYCRGSWSDLPPFITVENQRITELEQQLQAEQDKYLKLASAYEKVDFLLRAEPTHAMLNEGAAVLIAYNCLPMDIPSEWGQAMEIYSAMREIQRKED